MTGPSRNEDDARPGPVDGGPPERSRLALLVAVSLSSFLTPFLSSSLNLAIPALGRELHASAVALGAIVTSFLVASAACLLPFGRLGDLVGQRRLFLAGAVAQTVCLLAAFFATSATQLIALRFLQGASGAMAFATATAMVVAAFPAARRGRVLGITTAAVYVGLSLGPVGGGLIVERFGWRPIFLLGALLGLALSAILAWGVAEERREPPSERFDVAGSLLYAVPLGAVVGGISAWKTLPGARWALSAGLAGLAFFVWRDRRTERPLLSLRLFRSPVFAFSNLAALLNYCATFAVSFLLSLYLQVIRGLGPREAGLVLLAQPLLMAALSPLAGRLSDRIEPRRVASLGMALTAVALGLFALLGRESPLSLVVAELMLIGIGFGLFSSPNSNAVMSSVDRRDYGSAAAILGTMRLLGQALSMAIVALVTALVLGNARLGPAAAEGLLSTQRTSFALFALLCVAGVAASLARGRVRRTEG
jgi:EmrB/QacA subfamily drug resistance transporter